MAKTFQIFKCENRHFSLQQPRESEVHFFFWNKKIANAWRQQCGPCTMILLHWAVATPLLCGPTALFLASSLHSCSALLWFRTPCSAYCPFYLLQRLRSNQYTWKKKIHIMILMGFFRFMNLYQVSYRIQSCICNYKISIKENISVTLMTSGNQIIVLCPIRVFNKFDIH